MQNGHGVSCLVSFGASSGSSLLCSSSTASSRGGISSDGQRGPINISLVGAHFFSFTHPKEAINLREE